MKKKRNLFAVLFLLAALFTVLLPGNSQAASYKDSDPCYKLTPKLVSAAWSYVDEIYRQKYPELALEIPNVSAADQEVLQKLSDTITKGLTSPSKKANAIARWVKANITYDTFKASPFAIDTFYRRRGDCGGYAMLMTSLMRLADIPAVSCTGWQGNMQKNYTLGNYRKDIGHAWVLAWLDNGWYLFDPLMNVYQCKDQTYLSKWYFFDNIEGVFVYYDGMPPQQLNGGNIGVIYKDGHFVGFEGGKTVDSDYKLNVEGLTYNARFGGYENDGFEYHENSERKGQMILDECYSNGWFQYGNLLFFYARPTGIIRSQSIITQNGKTLFLDENGAAFYLPGKSSDYTLTSGRITIQKGQSLSGVYPYLLDPATRKKEGMVLTWMSLDPSIARVTEDGKITGISEGYVDIYYEATVGSAHMSGGILPIYVSDTSHQKADYADYSDLSKHGTVTLSCKRFPFTGSEIEINFGDVTVTSGPMDLERETDYTISYKNNIYPGTATIIIKGKGVFKGTIEKEFTITSADGTPVPDTPSVNTRPKKGQTLTHASGSKYLVTGTNTVTFKAPKKGAKTVTIPKTVTLKGYTFKVTAIASAAFRNNQTVTKITVGSNVTTIGQKAFSNCSKLGSVTLGGSVRTIGAYAFYRCTALKKLTIPASTAVIRKYAFYGCKKLTSLTMKTAKLGSKTIGVKAFTGTPKNLTIYVPKKQKTPYTRLLRGRGVSSKAKIK